MKIAHVCLVGAGYNDGWGYQENMLARYNVKNGHEVSVITTQFVRDQVGELVKIDKTRYIDEFSCNIYRLPLKKKSRPQSRFRLFLNLKKVLSEINPDIIFVHNFQFLDIFKIIEYVKEKKIKLYVDSHTDRNNSGRNWFSLNILHGIIYKFFMKRILKYALKVYYLSEETKDFLTDIYKVPITFLEFFPLGGIVISKETKSSYKQEIREKLNVGDSEILLCHSGKMNKDKKTLEIIKSFSAINDSRFRLIIIGKFTEDIKKEAMLEISKDTRIKFLGWKNTDELYKYIAASDLYLQPGSQSATMQSALCLGTPVMVNNTKSYKVFNKGNFFVIKNTSEIVSILLMLSENPEVLKPMSKAAFRVANEYLDYNELSNQYI